MDMKDILVDDEEEASFEEGVERSRESSTEPAAVDKPLEDDDTYFGVRIGENISMDVLYVKSKAGADAGPMEGEEEAEERAEAEAEAEAAPSTVLSSRF
jgi:hypothetical protein